MFDPAEELADIRSRLETFEKCLNLTKNQLELVQAQMKLVRETSDRMTAGLEKLATMASQDANFLRLINLPDEPRKE